jgi:hypothetical protein
MSQSFRSRIFIFISLIIGGLALGACSSLPWPTSGNVDTSIPEDPRKQSTGSLIGGRDSSGISLSGLLDPSTGGDGSLPVNAILWRASLDTVSVLPLDSVDTFGGTIITEWYAHPDDATKRIKLAIFVVDQELRSDAIQAKVYLQERRRGQSEWQDIGRDDGLATRVEDLILTRAREIRAAAIAESN